MTPTRAPRACLAAAVLLLVSLGGSPLAAQSLRNELLVATFDRTGLTSLRDIALKLRVPFAADHFRLQLNGEPIDSRALPAPRRRATPDRVTYAWSAGAFWIEVTYELRPGWRFLSKELRVVGAPSDRLRLDEVVPLDAELGIEVADTFVPKGARPNLGTADYGLCLRFVGGGGLLAVVQNPFLRVSREGSSVSVGYSPAMEWDLAWGPFVADRALLGPYRRTDRVLPERMLAEWSIGVNDGGPGMDEAEIDAFTAMVRAFLLAAPAEPVNVFVPWCANDYQIDVATPEGRAEFKRLLDNAADLGARYAIFAPTNSDLARREDSLDDWSWENLLWLGLGQGIRRGEWRVPDSEVPASVRQMLDYARSKGIRLLAYVYPVVPFSQNPEWLVSPPNRPGRQYANLGFRSLQDWLIETLVTFHRRLGLGGYAFDHTFLDYPGRSRYEQWWGWRRVMEGLRRQVPDIVIDGRQAYHLYGPWGWLAGSYPHPTFSDEQPESFVPFPDLHFDRVSANRERYTAYRYKNYEFAPSELVPGFITHQTSRADDTGEMPEGKSDKGVVLLPFRLRDWDYLGWRYSLLSSIAVAGWNNVIDFIPGRDAAEHEHFSDEDKKWFRRWIDWTAENRELLRRTRTILGQPAIGKVDGTAAIDGGRGAIFLFNPNGRRLDARFRLDESIGLDVRGTFVLEERYPLDGRLVGKPGAGDWSAGDEVTVSIAGGSAVVLELRPAARQLDAPVLYNVAGLARLDGGILAVEDARGEAGSSADVLVRLPPGAPPAGLRVNGRDIPFAAVRDSVMAFRVLFDGAVFGRLEPVVTAEASRAFAGGTLTARFSVPRRVFQQLEARRRAWPIPWTSEDFRTPWLAPERLLLFVQSAQPDDGWEARLQIDGRTVELRKAYTAVRTARRTFVGFYADVSLVEPDREHSLELELPALKPGQFQGVFFENVEPEYTDRIKEE